MLKFPTSKKAGFKAKTCFFVFTFKQRFLLVENKIKEKIKTVLGDCEIRLSSVDNYHFTLEVASPKFKDMKRLEQHRLILNCLAEFITNNELHALQIKTKAL